MATRLLLVLLCSTITLLDFAQPLLATWRVKFFGSIAGGVIYFIASVLLAKRPQRSALWVVAVMPVFPTLAACATLLGAPFPVDLPMLVIACLQITAGALAITLLMRKEAERQTLPAPVKRGISLFTYPLVMTGIACFAVALHARAVPPGLLVVVTTVTTSFVLFMLESVAPYRRSWGLTPRALMTDVLHSLVSNGVPSFILEASIKGVLLQMAFWLRSSKGLDLWPDSWPMWTQVLLALAAAEAGFYTVHRTLHESGIEWLWKLHSVHHSISRMYFFAATRTHPLQVLFSFGATVAILWALGAPDEVIMFKTVMHTTNGLFQHCNLDLRLGPLNWLIASTEMHRWHHSQKIEESNSNYGNNLIIFDVLFGTRFKPSDRIGPDEVGLLPNAVFEDTYLGHLRIPFESSGEKS
jgi:sterol desaturase/sphingolipid hydroxylase (fatty acid hydroxylase superfamily)